MAQFDSNQRQSLEARITTLAEQIAAGIGIEIVLVEAKGGGGGSTVRVFIDQPGGVTLDDCERFSKRLSVALDVEDWIDSRYTLEVSSPGLDRPLRKETDFQRFAGKEAKVRTRVLLDGQKNFRGRIVGAANGKVGLELDAGKQVEIAIGDIERANLIAVI